RRDDAEVAATAPKRPEQIGVLVLTRSHEAPVSEHHVGGEEVVDRQTAFPREMADAAAEDQTAGAGCRTRAGRRRKPQRMRPTVDVAEQRSTGDLSRPGGRIDADAAHPGKV